MSSNTICAGGTPVPRPSSPPPTSAPTSAPAGRGPVGSAIRAKRDGLAMDDRQVDAFIAGVASGAVSDSEAAAMCMAVFCNGMTTHELSRWTTAMATSGRVLHWDGPTVDKHSTGGVGDKTSLVVAPLLAAAGFQVPMLSGRSLGHTGGTLDKLEAVAGYRAELTADELRQVVHVAGCAIAAASPDLAPADRVLYRVRDETHTVASIPLIASSIVSKKLASGAGALVLDVKCGSAAFLPERDRARQLASTMVRLCHDAGVPAAALLTRMDVMCGAAAGNAAEVHEALELLAGGGDPALRALCLDLACAAAQLQDPTTSCERLAALLDSGHAMERFEAMLHAQGATGPLQVAEPAHHTVVRATRTGRVWFDALGLAHTAASLGACRAYPGDTTDPACGLWRLVPDGAEVRAGDELLRLEGSDRRRVEAVTSVARLALRWWDEGAPEMDGLSTVVELVDGNDEEHR